MAGMSITFGICGAGAGPLPSRPALAMCLPVEPASIAVPWGDRLNPCAFSGAGVGEGPHASQVWISMVVCTISSCTASQSRTWRGVSAASCVTRLSAQA